MMRSRELAVMVLLSALPASAERWEVTHMRDAGEGSLRQAIESANAAGAGEIGFADVAGTIEVESPLPTLTADLHLAGPTNRSVTLSGAGRHALLSVASGATVEVSRLSFTLARASEPRHGSALSNAGSLRLLHCRFEGNTNDAGWGGALYTEGNLHIEDSVFQNNAALGTPGTPGHTPNLPHRSFGGGAGAGGSGMGGAIYQARGTLDLFRCEFLNNTARGGSGIVPPSPPLMIETEGGLGGKAYGGALFCFDGMTRIVGCRFAGNLAEGGPGGLGQGYLGHEGGHSHGGALSAASITLQILDSRFTRNSSIGGTGGHPSLLGSPSTGGSGGDAIGGAIDLRPGGTCSMQRCVISTNTARGGTGGLGGSPGRGAQAIGGGLASRIRDLVVTASSLNANHATSGRFGGMGSWTPPNDYVTRGGGASIDAGSAVFINSTFSGNHVAQVDVSPDSRGGGLSQNSSGASVRLQFCTLVSNIVTRVVGIGPNAESPRSRGTGLWCPTNATVTLASTVIAANLPGTAGDIVGRVTSTGPNLIGDAREALGLADHDRTGLDPMLGPLTDFGDGLPTHAPLPGSPVLEAAAEASVPETDQRGWPRISGSAADLGAVEMQWPLDALSPPRLVLIAPVTTAFVSPAPTLRFLILAPSEVRLVLEESVDLTDWVERGTYHHGEAANVPLEPGTGFFRLRQEP